MHKEMTFFIISGFDKCLMYTHPLEMKRKKVIMRVWVRLAIVISAISHKFSG